MELTHVSPPADSQTPWSHKRLSLIYFVWICLLNYVCLCVSMHYHRVDIILRCLPQCVPGTWAATWSDLSMCQLFRSHDCRHPQVSCCYCTVPEQSKLLLYHTVFATSAGSCRERRMMCASKIQGQDAEFRAFCWSWSSVMEENYDGRHTKSTCFTWRS